MEANGIQEAAEEKKVRICISCGNKDTDEYCSKCGSKLEFLGEHQATSIQNLKRISKEYFSESLDPVFAYLKTTWLLLRYPVEFFQTLYFQETPINDLPFPLTRMWRKVSGERIQYTLHPVGYFVTNFAVNFVTTVFFLSSFIAALAEILEITDIQFLPSFGFTGFFTMLHIVAAAFIFDVLTQKSEIPAHFIYSFWVYIFSLSWVGPIIGLFILIIPLIPFGLILASAGATADALIKGTTGQDQGDMLLEIAKSVFYIFFFILFILFILTVLVVRVYCFVIIPMKVFISIFPREELSTRRLVAILAACLILPAIFLYLCALFINPFY